MGFDASRPVPWNLLIRRFGVMFIGAAVIVGISSRSNLGGMIGGLVMGGLLFFGLSWVLAKFGYAPKSMAQIKAEAAARQAERVASGAAPRSRKGRGAAPVSEVASRPRPAPTKRTASGVGRHPRPKGR